MLPLAGSGALALAIVAIVPRASPPRPRLVVLYAPCTVNRSFLSPYNPAVPYTPNLGAFAREGVVFTKHHTESALSGIAYAALFSGTQAMQHGVYRHPTRLDDAVYTISEAFRDAGYDVFMWADHDMASPELNYAQGVDPRQVFWDPDRARAHATQSGAFLRADDPTFASVLRRLREDPEYKAFLVTTFTVTHTPYSDRHLDEFCHGYPLECAGLDEADRRTYAHLFLEHNFQWQHAFDAVVATLHLTPEQVAKVIRVADLLYASNVAYLDGLFGDVVRAIDWNGLRDETLITFTTDHGERMYDPDPSGSWTHGFALTYETILIPWIMRGAGLGAGRYDGVTRSIDVLPTMAGLSGVALPPATVMGVDLSTALRHEAGMPELVAFSHTGLLPGVAPEQLLPALAARFPHNDPSEMWVAARQGDLVYKLTSGDGSSFHPSVFDWRDGPGARDLYDPHDERQRAMLRQLRAYKRSLIRGYQRTSADQPRPPLTEQQQMQLRALGYIR